MYLTPDDQKRYPKLAEYLRNRFPKLTGIPAIVAALKKHGHFTDAQLKLVLTWGQVPKVTIVSFSVTPCGPGGNAAYGCTRKANPGEVEVEKKYVEGFEKDAAAGVDNKNTRGSVVYVVGATLLHELCHWGNFKNGVVENKEMGLEFEKAVYGKTIW